MKEENKEKKHEHRWQNAGKVADTHEEGHTHLSYTFLQLCECGVYRTKTFAHESDVVV